MSENNNEATTMSVNNNFTRELPEDSLQNERWTIGDFDIGRPLGNGSFGKVFVAREKVSKYKIALKVLLRSQIINCGFGKQLKREIEIQYKLRHPNIIPLYGYFYDDKRVYVMLGFASRGELSDLLHSQPTGRLSEPIAARFARQLCRALIYCHAKGVIHRDIKPENLLLDADLNLKLADFGFSVVSDHSKRNTFCGTTDYLAPEMVLNRPHDFSVDIWAVGILIYEMILGCTPFYAKNDTVLMLRIQECHVNIPDMVSQHAKLLISSIIKLDPQERLSLREILHHAWIIKMAKQEEHALKEFIQFLDARKQKNTK